MIKRCLVFLVVGLLAVGVWGGLTSGEVTQTTIEKVQPAPSLKGYTGRLPIHIIGNSQFTSENGVVSGNGTQAVPYLIENWMIDGTGSNYCIWIENTNAHFILRNCMVFNANYVSQTPWGTGIYLSFVKNGMLSENNASNNHHSGIILADSSSNNINDTTALDNGYSGILLLSSNNNSIEHDIASRNWCGIDLSSSSNNSINNNTVSGNTNGGILFSDYGNIIIYNLIKDNNGYGICITDLTANNRIHHNNFIKNNGAGADYNSSHIQAYDDSTTNFWNDTYSNGGNYWSDWTSPDVKSGPNQDVSGSDGIVDSPYVLDGGAGAKDYYPLTTQVAVPDFSPAPLIILSVLLLTFLIIAFRKRF